MEAAALLQKLLSSQIGGKMFPLYPVTLKA